MSESTESSSLPPLRVNMRCFTCVDASQKIRIVLPVTNYNKCFPDLDSETRLTYKQARSLYPSWLPDECFVLPGIEDFTSIVTRDSLHDYFVPSNLPEQNDTVVDQLIPTTDRALQFVNHPNSIFIQTKKGYQPPEDTLSSISPILISFLRKYLVPGEHECDVRYELIVIVSDIMHKFDQLHVFEIPKALAEDAGGEYEFMSHPYDIVLYVGYTLSESSSSSSLVTMRLFTDRRNQFLISNAGEKRKRVECPEPPTKPSIVTLIEIKFPENEIARVVHMDDRGSANSEHDDYEGLAISNVRTKKRFIDQHYHHHFLIKIREPFHEVYGKDANFGDRMQSLLRNYYSYNLSAKNY